MAELSDRAGPRDAILNVGNECQYIGSAMDEMRLRTLFTRHTRMVMMAIISNAAFMKSGRLVMMLGEFLSIRENATGQDKGNHGQTYEKTMPFTQ